ncbi:MAG TPA: polysaccharide deacetylase family protein [Terriglobales bacterium]|nr:polysaccharide deacetylase family protein [Terriglobales bacterium]
MARASFRIASIAVVLLVNIGSFAQNKSAESKPSPKIAFTFDDLPVHGPLPAGETRMQVISKIISALKNGHLPPVYGFVNGKWTETEPEDIAVLRAWHDAGNPLGNHTWSHLNFNEITLQEFETEVTSNEPLLSSLMKNQDWHWLRFPFLAEGDTPEKRNAIRVFLAQRGYRVAGVTMSFSDYLWNEPYARCKAKSDNKSISELESTYLQAARDYADFSRELSHRLYNRDIPYVLLMHVGAFDAEMLPRLLQVYREEGFEFVTLRQAEKDEFYRNDVNLKLPASADSLEQMMAKRGLPLPPRPSPNPRPESLCR